MSGNPTYLCEAVFNIPIPFGSEPELKGLYTIKGVREVTLTQASTVKVRFGVTPDTDLFTIQNALCRFLEGVDVTAGGYGVEKSILCVAKQREVTEP